MSNIKRKTIIILVISVILAVLLIIGGIAIYASDYYRADAKAIRTFAEKYGVERNEIDGGLTFGDIDSEIGFIFYPGGKVEYTSYEPLMTEGFPGSHLRDGSHQCHVRVLHPRFHGLPSLR